MAFPHFLLTLYSGVLFRGDKLYHQSTHDTPSTPHEPHRTVVVAAAQPFLGNVPFLLLFRLLFLSVFKNTHLWGEGLSIPNTN